ncbi:hypothetical protein [Nesterenkonia xinjiangensis]|uniref:Uncharacterized protein n=1 Tax=Nesterenkonia xinjiangensis TaxID=225327 RepID=A0A7Z0GJ75_9MICC|nr:hypothetical protein [Nesterenkonia xinjiangensis]NYJ76991.1 hypothetical protein [Nesterenkonia xinjiangensis]
MQTSSTSSSSTPTSDTRVGQAPAGAASADSWSTSLETWARGRHGEKVLTVASTMDFAPLGTLRPQTFYELPVVMAVMTRRSASLHAALTRAVEIIREATYAFRMVVVTDVPTSAPVRTVDWTVEHLLGEADWAALQGENWLPAAVDHLEWARRQYGASLVLAPESPEQVLADIARVGAFSRAPEKIMSTAAELARQALPEGPQAGGSASQEERALRGWWRGALEDGLARQLDLGEGFTPTVTVIGGDSAGVIVADGVTAGEALQGWASESGWSVVRIGRAEAAGPTAERLHQALLRAAGEGAARAVGAAGPLLLITDQQQEEQPVPDGLDGVVVLHRPEEPGTGWSAELLMGYGASTRIRAAELPTALDRLRRIHLATTL